MGLVTISLNGRTYRLSCGTGQEARLLELADNLNQRIEQLAMDSGQYGDERLLVMAALLTTDELLEARARAAGPQKAAATPGNPPPEVQRSPAVPVSPPPPKSAGDNAGKAPEPASEATLAVEHSPTPAVAPTPPPAPPASASGPDHKSIAASAPAPNSLEARLAQAKAAAKVAPTPKVDRA